MSATRSRSWMRSLPPIALITLALGVAWSIVLCIAPPPGRFWCWQLQGTGIAAASLGAVLLGARMDLRGAWLMPIWVAVAFTHSLWAVFIGVAAEAALATIGLTGARSAGVPLVIGTGAAFIVIVIIANRNAWSLLPLGAGITFATTFASFTAGSILHSAWYGPSAAAIFMGVLGSFAWGVAIVRARADSIGSGRCPSCGYDTSTIDGACPECGKHRDEVKDGLL
jgi:hypothetical protein